LCSRIGIMSRGALKCLGANVRLKNKFGEGYTLKINFDVEDEELATGYIKKILPQAVLIETFPGNYSYGIPSKDFVISKFLKKMIKKKDKYKIYDWGITQSSLQDVFLNIVKNDEQANAT